MKKILALTTLDNTVALKQAVELVRKEYGHIVEVKKVYFADYEDPDVPLDDLKHEMATSDIVLVDIRGDIRICRELPGLLKGRKKNIVVLIGGSQHIFAMTRMGKFKGEKIFKPGREKEFNIHTYTRTKKFSELAKKLGKYLPFGSLKDMRNWVLALEYYEEGDPENLKNLILMLLKYYAGLKKIRKVPPPKAKPSYGLYLPDKGMIHDTGEFKQAAQFDDEKPTVGILFYGGMHFQDTAPIVDAVYRTLKADANIIPVHSKVECNIEAINNYLKDIDLLINLQYFRIHGGPYGGEPDPTYEYFTRTNVPYLVGLRSYETEITKWKESKQGINPLEVILGITLPELDGGIEPIFVAGLESSDDPDFGKIKQIRVIQNRIAKLCNRTVKWLALRRKANKEKRIAVLTYNYPPGEENLASAGYLDVFESMHHFLNKMKERGYGLQIPEGSLKDLFLDTGLVNSPNYLKKSGIRVRVETYVKWFRGLPMAVQKEVVKHWGEPPGDIMVEDGQILVPGLVTDNLFIGIQPSRGVMEDVDKAYHDKDLPPHHQYLAYYYFLEYEFGADAVVHFGMHGTLEFTKGKEAALSDECYPDVLIGNLPNIYYYWIGNTSESTIAKRRSYAICISHASPVMKSSGLYEKYIVLEDLMNQHDENQDPGTLEAIRENASGLHLPSELPEIRKEIYRMKKRLIPHGLHVMDEKPARDELVDYLLGVLRIDREYPSILKLLASEKGLEWDHIKYTRKADNLESEAKNVVKQLMDGRELSWLPGGYGNFVQQVMKNCSEPSESSGLLRALEGQYVFPACGGDPIRDPDVYPSGRAMYAFDPRLVPTVAAETRGKAAAASLVESYWKKNGRDPESIGIILWGFETMKTGGDTIATILSLLGIRIKHKKSPWFKELEVIPLEELGRPRIDVLITMCGIFRDTFGTHIDLLNRAIDMVAQLDEPSDKNFVRKHILEAGGELGDIAQARIFGPSPSEYATSMRTLVETSSWDEEKDLVKSYDDSMSYAYYKGRVEKNEQAFSEILKSVDIVAQERDNTEYEVTDLDHYYEFLGGLSRTVQDKKGEKAEILVVDTTEEDVMVEDLQVTIERASRTRTLNPKWIDGMLEHDFHGTKKIKDRVEHLLGFAATTGKVENWVFDEVGERLIFDEKMRRRLLENNPYATLKICELLVETERRGYWQIDEARLKELRNIILKMESDIE
jgi:cobaltochelatase CobN